MKIALLLLLLSALLFSVNCIPVKLVSQVLGYVAAGFLESLPKELIEEARSTSKVLGGFKQINAIEIVKEAKYAVAKGPTGTEKYAVLCRYAACHDQKNVECNNVCDSIAPKVDPSAFEHRIGTLKGTTADVAAWNQKCSIFCGNNDCAKECSALSATHFSFANRAQYEAEFNELMERIREAEKRIPAKYIEGFKHINAKALLEEANAAAEKSFAEPTAKYAVLCRYGVCHGNGKAECSKACDAFAAKVDQKAFEGRIGKVAPTDVSPDIETCHKKCYTFCAAKDCTKECDVLCATHFSFANRKEYEAEFYELMKRTTRV